MKKMLLSIVILLSLVCSPLCFGEPDQIEAWVMAQDFVESALKAPSTAKFSKLPWHLDGGKFVDFGDGSYYIMAYVDAQNSYGAMVRQWFSIVVTYVGSNEWKASDLHWLNK